MRKKHLVISAILVVFIVVLIAFVFGNRSNEKILEGEELLNAYINLLQNEEYNEAMKLLYFDEGYEAFYDLLEMTFEEGRPTISDFKINRITEVNQNIFEVYAYFKHDGDDVDWKPYIFFHNNDIRIILNYSNIPQEYKDGVTNHINKNALDFKGIEILD